MKIEIHSKTMCPYCHHAKEYLHKNGISYTEYVYDDADSRNEMYDGFDLLVIKEQFHKLLLQKMMDQRSELVGIPI